MNVFSRDNVITAVCVVVAIAAFYGLGRYTELGDAVRFGALILVGVVLPMLLTDG